MTYARVLLISLALLLVACNQDTIATPTPSLSPTAALSPSVTTSPTPTPSPSPTATATASPTVTASATWSNAIASAVYGSATAIFEQTRAAAATQTATQLVGFPTPTIEFCEDVPIAYRVRDNIASLNIRIASGTEHEIIGVVRGGEIFEGTLCSEPDAREQYQWAQRASDGGWVALYRLPNGTPFVD